jgi:protein TonB
MLPKAKRQEVVPISLAEVKKSKPKPKPPEPPPPPPEEKPKPPPPPKAQPQAKAAPEPEAKPAAPPPEAAPSDGFADLGISLGNAGGGGGVALGAPRVAATAAPTAAPTAAATAAPKVRQLTAAPADACNDPVVKPKRKAVVTPKYTMEARQAEIEGVVRVEVTIDEHGNVIGARVLAGLGYGLDDSAIAAAKASTFEPATRCGKPVVGTAVLPFRFQAI